MMGEAAKRWELREAWGAAENGHSYTGHQPVADKRREDPAYLRYVESLEGNHSPERLAEVLAPAPSQHSVLSKHVSAGVEPARPRYLPDCG